MELGEVCEHSSLKRQCPHCEVIEQDKRIAELEESVNIYRDGYAAINSRMLVVEEQRDRLAAALTKIVDLHACYREGISHSHTVYETAKEALASLDKE